MHSNYTQDQKNWLKAFIPGKTTEETVEAYKKQFGEELTLQQVRSFRKNYRVRCGIDARFKKGQVSHNKGKKYTEEEKSKWSEAYKASLFKKGRKPYNAYKVGQLRRKRYQEYIKVAEPDQWMLYGRYVWQQYYNEKLTINDSILHLDGDCFNNSIENLAKVTRQEMIWINRNSVVKSDPELTKTALIEMRLRKMIFEKGEKRCQNCIYYEAVNNKKFYCNNPKYKREKRFSVANRCLGYRKA